MDKTRAISEKNGLAVAEPIRRGLYKYLESRKDIATKKENET